MMPSCWRKSRDGQFAPNVRGSTACTKPDRRRFDFRLGPHPVGNGQAAAGFRPFLLLAPPQPMEQQVLPSALAPRSSPLAATTGSAFFWAGFLRSFFLAASRAAFFFAGLLLARSLLLLRWLLLAYRSASSSLLLLGLLWRASSSQLFSLFSLRCHGCTPSKVDKRCCQLHPAVLARASGRRSAPQLPNW